MRYAGSELIEMSQKEFCDNFTNKYVKVAQKDDTVIQGHIMEIGLAENINPDTQDHLPVTIKIESRNINIFDIKSIELL